MSNNTKTLDGAYLIYKSQSEHFITQSFTFTCDDSMTLRQAVNAISFELREEEWADSDMADEDFMAVGVGYPEGTCADGQWIQVGFHPIGSELMQSIVRENRLTLEEVPLFANHALSLIG